MKDLIPVETIRAFGDEPRIRDLELARFLEMRDLHEIRRLIERNRPELEMHGAFSVTTTENTGKRGRPGKAYWLNEGQALVICALSRTPIAAKVRHALIEVFQAYRAGKLVHVVEHRRRPPAKRESGPRDFHGQPCIRDHELAEILGESHPHYVRQLIADNGANLRRYGTIWRDGRDAYWLNEGQALAVCYLFPDSVRERGRAGLHRAFHGLELDKLCSRGVEDVREALRDDPDMLLECVALLAWKVDKVIKRMNA